ncbi:DUF4442 domain-containing protein [Ruania zhangjianzhongii]|uniref:DUF4442 domain-containing protein n=1 Tax=Ruania zhangjianzhongii TaxID=2603206 RepID=UPI0011CB535B|nr:DUF4442 domain-containing protein [Ruania zhangjianzhongii]
MSQTQHALARLARSPRQLRLLMNAWPPFLFSGIRIRRLSEDFRHVQVRLAKHLLTSNYFGTQFGGTMFAMTDPFWTILVAQNLGPGYTVWDRSAEIEFLAPGRTAVTAEFTLSQDTIDELRSAAEGGQKVLHWFSNDITATDGTVVARTRKQVYIRRK